MTRKKITLVERKLGAHHAAGLSWGDGVIEVDPRLNSQDYMEVVIHECVHEFWPSATEEQVAGLGRNVARLLWEAGYRRTIP